MRFTKMHGLGNDFIMINQDAEGDRRDWNALARRMCDRHFGVGADGVLLVGMGEEAPAYMRVLNSDGSDAQMCGNGLRCAAVFLREEGIVKEDEFHVETGAGILHVAVSGTDVVVDMGRPTLEPEDIPVAAETNLVRATPGDRELSFFCVSMGNPHAVTFDAYPDRETFLRWGAAMEVNPLFPEKANIEFCRVRDGGIDVRVWERGDGETLACGTGACAVMVAAASQGLIGREADIRLPGGTLHIRWAEDDHLIMTGPTQTVFRGEW